MVLQSTLKSRLQVCLKSTGSRILGYQCATLSSSSTIADELDLFASKPQTGVSLKTLGATGRGDFLPKGPSKNDSARQRKLLSQVAMFLHHELPIRLSHRVRDLACIPHLHDTKGVISIRNMYIQSFEEIKNAKIPDTPESEEKFCEIITKVYERHASVLLLMAKAFYEFRSKMDKKTFADDERIHTFLDAFYMSRIGIRVMIGQYLALRQTENTPDMVGLICEKASPADLTSAAVEDAKFMCEREYGAAPEVSTHGRLDLTFEYIPSHVHYILVELLKNSMRATMEYHGEDCEDLPCIRVVIADGPNNEDIVIKVSDEGGGISRSNMSRIWSYLFTTANPAVQEHIVGDSSDFGTSSPLAGLGYGLPIARTYARYFGGDLNIMSMEGYGTDAFVHIPRLGNADEPIPKSVDEKSFKK